ncbi:hypothetical protein A3J56_01590 [Candidatus Giovannonibacteria bacterium RIFCSPHIGHO2_02_FULL_46_20]|uniref:Uncharacterized protein n=1 Tax=Candidatus Giovannonibacteria bacterium RIFCSPHIGHO2_02_FULL_46_20 TaxID=1798338 RepID=A0A1F5WGQ9_9BACT|nr:MAG: hypothetical protein A3J56_01590 [Candidatus Giovannonibacteria bacterium RIFCSPHIGHO2_02_FULL_46_20]
MKFEQLKPEGERSELDLKQEYTRLLEEKVGKQIDESTKKLGRALTESEIQQEPWFSDYMKMMKLREEITETGREINK